MRAREKYLGLARQHLSIRPGGPGMWSPELETMDPDGLRALQSTKLAAAFDYLFESSLYYRARFKAAGLRSGAIRSVDDLSRIPVTRKLDWIPNIEANPPWGTFSPLGDESWSQSLWMIFSTSGTTRRPRLFRYTNHDRELWAWLSARALWSYGVRPSKVSLNCFYYGGSVAAWGLHEGLNLLGCAVVPGGAMPPVRRAALLSYLRPQVLLGTPSGLLTLGHRVAEQGDDPASLGVEVLVCAGEPGAAVPSTKARLEELFGAAVHDDFGCTEVAMGPLGYTCSFEASRREGPIGVHLMEDSVIVEVLHPETYDPVPPGERGTLVVSNLYSESAPFLRFDMGDWVQVSDEPCGCGRTHWRAIGGLLGRNEHCLNIKGLQFFSSTFEDAIRAIPGLGEEYRITVRRETGDEVRDEVEVVVERSRASTLTVEEVLHRLHGSLGIRVQVRLQDHGSLSRTDRKGDRFVDLR